MRIALLGQTGEELYTDASYQLTKNWYQHISPDAKSPLMLYPTPGVSTFTNVGTGQTRGMIEFGAKLYVVIGNELYRVESTGAKTLLAGSTKLSTTTGRVSMAHNGSTKGRQICIADGTSVYIYDSVADTLTIPAGAPTKATHIQFMDGYFIANNPNTSGQFAISNLYQGNTWTGSDVADAERSPDDLQAVLVSDRVLYLIGTHTVETWVNTGNLDFPLSPMQSGFSQWGTIAPYSPVDVSGIVFWLSQNEEGVGQVVMATGGQVQVISTYGISAEITKMSSLEDAYGWTYQYHHHTFYVLTFPTDKKTFVYDITTKSWHQWETKSLGYFRASHHVYVYGKHFIGDNTSNSVSSLDWEIYTDLGEPIQRVRRSKNITAQDPSVNIVHKAVQLDIKEGVGNSVVADPQMKLRWRDDNGPWSSYHSRSMGKLGEHRARLIWRRLGRSKDRVYEISTQDAVPCVLIDSWANLYVSTHEVTGD